MDNKKSKEINSSAHNQANTKDNSQEDKNLNIQNKDTNLKEDMSVDSVDELKTEGTKHDPTESKPINDIPINDQAANDEDESNADNKTSQQLDELQAETEKMNQQIKKQQEDYIRLAADYDNYRKRSKQELANKIKYSTQSLANGVIGCLDELEIALHHIETNQDRSKNVDEIITGIKMTLDKFNKMLVSQNITPIDALNQDFDPNLHEALAVTEDKKLPNNQVITVIKRGYKLHERVIRPAAVQVNKIPT